MAARRAQLRRRRLHTSLAEALNGAGWLASARDHIHARSLFERSLALRREQGDEQSVAGLLLNLGSVAGALGEYDQEVALCEQSLSLYQALGDRRAAASALGNLALALEHSDPERAESLYTESLALFEEVGDHRGAAITLTNLGWSALLKGGHAQAEVHCKAALRIYGELRNQEGIAYLP
ncbi:MAG: tetratricopeptide repeat protein [Chloroflexia bacterium]